MQGMDHIRVQRMAQCALLGALALVLSYIETMIPLPFAVPGIKLGLANAAVLVALLLVDSRAAVEVALVKVLASGFLFGTPTMLAYSAGGTVLAVLVMLVMARPCGLGAVPVSMASAICHNIGQLAVAAFMLSSTAVFATLPVLAVAACATGAIIGVAAQGVVSALQADAGCDRVPVDLSGFELHPGEHVAFVGANGSGKSTAALQLAGLLAAGDAADGAGVGAAGDLAPVRLVMQDPANQMVKGEVEDDVAFGPENLGMPLLQMHGLVAKAMADIDVQELAASDVNELSGGQGQQVAIAGVLAMQPGAIVFDEATSMLDVAARARFEALVGELCAAGVAVVTVTQLASEALAADRAVLFEAGKISYIGTPACALSKLEADILPAYDCDALQEDATASDDLSAGAGVAADVDATADAAEQDRALRCDGLCVAYPGSSARVLDGVSLSIEPGCVLGLTGPCGCGKSTLARTLAGYLLPEEGTVRLDGLCLSVTREVQDAYRRKVAYVNQRPEQALFAQTAFDDVLFGALNLGLDDDEAQTRATAALEAVGINPDQAKEKSPFSYSGGEQRRIAIAGMLVLDTPYLILDEPCAGLDPLELRRLAGIIAKLRQEGKGILLIAHDDAFLRACVDSVVEVSALGAFKQQQADLRARAPRRVPARFGRYVPGCSLMHGLDARAKLVLCLLYMIAGFVAQGWLALGLVALFGAGMLAVAKTTPRQAWAAFRPFIGLMVFVGLFDLFFTGGDDIWWQAGPLCVSAQSASFAAQSVLRFALVAIATSTLMATTSATQLGDGCTALLEPLRRLGVRVDDTALSLSMTLRFVPLVQGEFFAVKRAQKARLAHFNSGNVVQRVKAYGPVFVPLFAGCLRRSQDLALAIQNRAYGCAAVRSRYRRLSAGAADAASLLLAAALVIVVIALRVIA